MRNDGSTSSVHYSEKEGKQRNIIIKITVSGTSKNVKKKIKTLKNQTTLNPQFIATSTTNNNNNNKEKILFHDRNSLHCN